MLEHYPACIADPANGPRGKREALCLRRHGLMEWFSLHLQARARATLHSRRATAHARARIDVQARGRVASSCGRAGVASAA
jgi:hypothetical protein